jgi:hypothetical protein
VGHAGQESLVGIAPATKFLSETEAAQGPPRPRLMCARHSVVLPRKPGARVLKSRQASPSCNFIDCSYDPAANALTEQCVNGSSNAIIDVARPIFDLVRNSRWRSPRSHSKPCSFHGPWARRAYLFSSPDEATGHVARAPRGFVQRLDFVTSFGNGDEGDHRACLGIRNKEPTKLITDLAIFEPDPVTSPAQRRQCVQGSVRLNEKLSA